MSRVYSVRVGKVRIRVMVRVSVIYHRDWVIVGVNGRCRLCSSIPPRTGL